MSKDFYSNFTLTRIGFSLFLTYSNSHRIKYSLKMNKQTDSHTMIQDFPGDPVVKNPPAYAGNMGSIPGPGKFHTP